MSHRRESAIAPLLVIAALLFTGGCQQPGPVLTESANDSTTNLAAGQILTLQLSEDRNTDCRWQLSDYDDALLALTVDKYIWDNGSTFTVGYGGWRILQFAPEQTGETQLILEMTCPDATEPVERFEATVSVDVD